MKFSSHYQDPNANIQVGDCSSGRFKKGRDRFAPRPQAVEPAPTFKSQDWRLEVERLNLAHNATFHETSSIRWVRVQVVCASPSCRFSLQPYVTGPDTERSISLFMSIEVRH